MLVANHTISIGIDLGTTNSSVAINNQDTIEIVKKPGGVEYTPSVFGFDKAKNKVVGQRAYDSLFLEFGEAGTQNYKPEVKRIIGTPETFYFERGSVAMSAEEISAEILKSLKQDILRKYPAFDTTAVVIAIPAAFSVLQCEATKRAGNLAGFKHVVLLQEPIAAAIAYGFAKGKDENWLVYDLGGGTFDIALISSRDGILSVLGHNGDNFLGGKNIDWDIVDNIITPKLQEKFSLGDFRRDNKSNSNKFGRLKYLAEKAKIELSQYETTTIDIDGIGEDDSGAPVACSMNLSRKQIEALIRPLMDRTIDLCKDTLGEAGLNYSSVSRIVLVGGPTQIPYIARRLESDLGIKTDASVDPLTVVARGACIFALSQKIPNAGFSGTAQQKKNGAHAVSLNHATLSAETQQAVTGAIEGLPSGHEYYLLIQSESGNFVSTKVPLRNGKFFTNVILEPNKSTLFWVYLFDSRDKDIPIDPESFTITHGLSIAGAPIPHSIGVVVSQKGFRDRLGNSEIFERLIEKGSVLPARRTENFKTVRDLKRSEGANPLWIRIGEGESDIPDRNTFVCELGIKGSDLPRDLPEGTELELTIDINEMRELSVTAYIPLLDLRMNARSTFVDELVNLNDVESEFDTQLERARSLSDNCSKEQVTKIDNAVRAVSTSLQSARLDEDEKRKAVKQVKDLKIILDRAQQAEQMPHLTQEFTEGTTSVREIIANVPDSTERERYGRQLDEIKTEGEKAILESDKTLLISVNGRLRELGARALHSDPSTWLYHFRRLTDGSAKFTNEREAAYFTEKGLRAINSRDVDELKRCCRGLANLLPLEKQELIKANVSGITH